MLAASAIFLVSSLVSRTMLQDSRIPSLLEPSDAQTAQEIGCDSIVFVIDDNGNVYSGKNVIGSLADTLDLTTKLKKVIEAKASWLAYASGMDLKLELPPRCTNKPVYLKTESHANDSRTLALIRALREVGINPTWLIARRKSREAIQ